MSKQRLLPAGAMVQLSAELIDEGKFLHQLNRTITKAHAGLAEYRHETSDGTASCTIQCQIKISYDPEMANHVLIEHAIKSKLPGRKVRTLVKEAGTEGAEILLVQPTGSSSDNPDQLRMFDNRGKPIGVLDKTTGEVIDEKPDQTGVAGRIATGN